LGLFAKCSLFSMLPIIEELALGLQPNSHLHQILHFLHVQQSVTCLGLQIAIDPRTINLIRPEPNSSKHPASVNHSRAACFFIFTPPRVSRTTPLFGLATSDSAHCHQTQQCVEPTLFLFFANGSHLHASSSISVVGLPLSHHPLLMNQRYWA